MKESILLKANGMMEFVKPENGKTFSLKELQKLVGGYIEIVDLSNLGYGQKLMVCNEEGKLMNLPFNDAATALMQSSAFWNGIDYIVGDVLICDSNMIE